jgi:hypothetical protein
MDKGRHPHVIRTWTVERTKSHYRPPQQSKLRPDPHQTFPGPARHPKPPVLPPHGDGKPV